MPIIKGPLTVEAGAPTEVIRRFGGSVPVEYSILVAPSGPGGVGGTLSVRGSRWLWWKSPVTSALAPVNVVRKGFWDTRFSVIAEPDARVEIRVVRGRVESQ